MPPTCLRHSVERFAKHRQNVYAKKGGVIFILTVVLLLPAAPTMPAAHKGCFYKVGQFQLCKDSLALLTHSLYERFLI